MTSSTATITTPYSDLHPNLVISSSRKAHHLLFTKMRDTSTSSVAFVQYSKRSMRILAEDALAEFPSTEVKITTPCGPFDGVSGPDPTNICAVSIIRSGDALLEVVREVEPAVRVGKILIQRDESIPEKTAKLFYSKLPPDIANQYVLLCDPMLATGGSAMKAIEVLVDKYNVQPSKIIFAIMICAPEGLKVLGDAYPEIKIVTAAIDDGLNDDKFIVPGLGTFYYIHTIIPKNDTNTQLLELLGGFIQYLTLSMTSWTFISILFVFDRGLW
jgi:uracil phosphoribosyltransferase